MFCKLKFFFTLSFLILGLFFVSAQQMGSNDDFDGDGIANVSDIDDDNDGVLDAVESPRCFFSEEEALIIVPTSVSSDISLSSGTLPNIADGFITTYFTFTHVIPVDDLTILEFETTVPIELTTILFENDGSSTSSFLIDRSSEPATAKMQAWDGSSWLDLTSNLDENDVRTNISITMNQGAYKKYRLYGIDGATSAQGRLAEIVLTAASGYVASYHPKNTPCTQDRDEDTYPNHFDTDSDGDGCFDALESGTTSDDTAETIPGPYGSNGFADSLQDSSNPDVYNDTYTYSGAINPNVGVCIDTDGDDVADIDDMDDDNDGILDNDERGASTDCFYKVTRYYNKNSSNNFTLQTNTPSLETNFTSIDANGLPWVRDSFPDLIMSEQVLGDVFPVSSSSGEEVVILDIEVDFSSQTNVQFRIQTSTFWDHNYLLLFEDNVLSPNSISQSVHVSTKDGTFSPETTPISPEGRIKLRYYHHDDGASNSGRVQWKSDQQTSYIRLDGSTFPSNCQAELDTDGDGIPNHLDIDSDNDRCFDADEAYGQYATDSNSDGTYGGSIGPSHVNSDGTVIGAPYNTGAVPSVIDNTNKSTCPRKFMRHGKYFDIGSERPMTF